MERAYGRHKAQQRESVSECVCVCVCMSAHFHCVLVNLIDCTATTWAFYSHYDFDEHFTNHKA